MRVRLIGFVIALLAAGAVSAHETWLMPTPFDAKPGEAVKLELTSGMDFPDPGTPAPADRVAKAAYRLGGAERALELTQSFAKPGVAAVWVELKPKEIELNDDEVAEYLDEIGATAATRAIWAGQKGRVPWRETYTKQAKSFVAVGGSADRSWERAVGMSFEIVPLDDPLSARSGGELTIRMLARGEPLASAPVGLIVAGSKERVFKTTDAKGKATFPLPRAGAAMLFAVRLRPTADGTRWESDFTTTTFRIR